MTKTRHQRQSASVREKPSPNASIFARAAWLLNDYADLLQDTCDGAADDLITEARELDERLQELAGQWERKRKVPANRGAAEIVSQMLKDWGLPGTVWYSPRALRWRVTGDNYSQEDGEICVGTYSPDASIDTLHEDFDAAMASPTGEKAPTTEGSP